MLKDEKLLADIKKLNIAFDPTSGDKIQNILVNQAIDYPALRDKLKALTAAAESGP